jgi:hypothetical protein
MSKLSTVARVNLRLYVQGKDGTRTIKVVPASVNADLAGLAAYLGRKAANNKSKKAREAGGYVEVVIDGPVDGRVVAPAVLT